MENSEPPGESMNSEAESKVHVRALHMSFVTLGQSFSILDFSFLFWNGDGISCPAYSLAEQTMIKVIQWN